MTELDDLQRIERLDSLGVLSVIERFGEQCARAWALGREVRGLPTADGLENLLLLGMGGSGFSGDVVRVVVEPRLPLPLCIVKGYPPLPEWVGRNTLVLAASYSGNTAETLAAFSAAHDRGARLVAAASGGRLAELAAEYGCTCIPLPGGMQPRASLGYLTLPLLAVLNTMELVPDLQPDVEEAIEIVESITGRSRREVAAAENPAKQLARIIAGRVPVFYGGTPVAAAAAYRAKCDVNEYAKQPAFSNEIPEMNHNEIEGWGVSAAAHRATFAALFLRDSEEDEVTARRMDITRRLVRVSVADALEVWAEGESALARVLHLVTLVQTAAIYAAFLNGVDPGPVEVIEKLKAALAESQQ